MTETILGTMRVPAVGGVGRRLVHVSEIGPESYSAGGFEVTVTSLTKVDHVIAEATDSTGTYLAVTSVSGNVVTIQAFSALGTEVVDTTDIHTSTFKFFAVGR